MRDYQKEFESRTAFIRARVEEEGAAGFVYGNSGGKDSALVGILCKAACSNTVGVILPCGSSRNFGVDRDDGLCVAAQYGIETRELDLTDVRETLLAKLSAVTEMTAPSTANIAPRLRMTAHYAIAGSENRLVAGTGNRSEAHMGYFTKWGDGAYDFNPIGDLTVTEIYEFLRYLGAPEQIIRKAPSAGLFDGQTDESEMGVTYRAIDDFLLNGKADADTAAVIARFHAASAHKRKPVPVYPGEGTVKQP